MSRRPASAQAFDLTLKDICRWGLMNNYLSYLFNFFNWCFHLLINCLFLIANGVFLHWTSAATVSSRSFWRSLIALNLLWYFWRAGKSAKWWQCSVKNQQIVEKFGVWNVWVFPKKWKLYTYSKAQLWNWLFNFTE